MQTAIISADVGNAFALDARTTTNNADGTISTLGTVFDSGDQIIFAFQTEDGQRDWRLEVDGDNSSDWLYRVTEYDVDGINPIVTTYDTDAALPELYVGYALVELI